MSDLIDRQAAIDALAEEFYHNEEDYRTAVKAIGGLPSVQPRKGKWIRTRTMTHDGEVYCDQCEQEHPEQKLIWNFCPNCGCHMEEGDSDEKD